MIEIYTNYYKDELPDFLYHYTTIKTLALILKYKTLRLNPLSNVDDKEEAKTKDTKGLDRYTFVSCWTDDPHESIPLWHMYADKYNGVRIKMKNNPFKKYKIKLINSVKNNYNGARTIAYDSKEYDSFLCQEHFDANDYVCIGINTDHISNDSILVKVQYTDNDNLICPPKHISGFKQDKDGKFEQTISNFQGLYKRAIWEFQKEWRYMLTFYPSVNGCSNIPTFDYIGINTSMDCDVLKKAEINKIDKKNSGRYINDYNGGIWEPFPHIDLIIDETAFSEMEILLGPKVSDGEKIIIENLVEKFNPTATVRNSSLYGKIR